MSNNRQKTYRIAFIGIMAAMVCVVTYFRFPFLGSQVHFANAFCLLAGLLFGGRDGFLAAGIGSALYDLVGFYGPADAVVTFLNKGLMALACAKLARLGGKTPGRNLQTVLACLGGALTYVALYMTKTFLERMLVYGLTFDATLVVMASKLPASLINACFATIAAPVLHAAVAPVLKKAGFIK